MLIYKEYEEIILNAEFEAEKQHDHQLFKYVGAGSCIAAPIGIPLSFLILNSKPPYYSNFDQSNPKYQQLKNKEEKKPIKKLIMIKKIGCEENLFTKCREFVLDFIFFWLLW